MSVLSVAKRAPEVKIRLTTLEPRGGRHNPQVAVKSAVTTNFLEVSKGDAAWFRYGQLAAQKPLHAG